jgi:pimeloyl-ACP methyl ester carboxylesterase
MRALKIAGLILVGLLLILAVVPFLIPIPPLEDTVSVEALADPDSQFVEVNGLNVHYKRYGQGEPYIILLHGFGASTFSWREVTQPLAQAGTVIAFDRPAFGLTERPLPEEWQDGANPYAAVAQVDLLLGLMDTLGVERAILVGNSAGGTVSMNAALRQPERVRALVLVDPAVYVGGGGPSWIRPLFALPQMDRIGPLFVRSISDSGMDVLSSAWHDTSLVTDEVIEGYRKPLRAENWDVALWYMTKGSRASALAERLDEFTMPVLVVTGDDDRIVPTDDSIRLAGELPGAELVVFPRCGHVPHEECPQAFLDAVLPFIQQHGRD